MIIFSAAHDKLSFNNLISSNIKSKLFGVVGNSYFGQPPRSAIFSRNLGNEVNLLLLAFTPGFGWGIFSNSAASRLMQSICRCVCFLIQAHPLLVVSHFRFARLRSGLLRIIDGVVNDGIVRRSPALASASKSDRHGWCFISLFSWPFGQELLTKMEYRSCEDATRRSIGDAYD